MSEEPQKCGQAWAMLLFGIALTVVLVVGLLVSRT